MGFFRKVKKKLDEGFLEEFLEEARWVWVYIRRYRSVVAVHIGLSILAIVLSLGTSVAVKYLIDAVTGYRADLLGRAAAAAAGMALGNVAAKSISSRIGAVLNIRVHNEIQAETFQRVLETDWESLEQYRSGDLLSRITGDVSTVAGGVINFVPRLISAVLQFVGALLIILYYDPTMALLALIGVPVSVLSSRALVGKMKDYNKKMKSLGSDMMSFYEDTLSNVTSVKAFGITGLFGRRMREIQKEYRDEYLNFNRFSVTISAVMSLIGLIVTAACFGWGVYRLWLGAITYGSMTMFLRLASTLGGAFSALIGLAPTAISVSTSAGRIMALTGLVKEAEETAQDYHGCRDLTVHLEHVSFSYMEGDTVLRDVSFSAGDGDLVALSGVSGEGKTTILRMLLGLIYPKTGSAVLCCGDGELPLSAATRSAFSYVPQGNSVFSGTVADNLRMVRPEATDDELWAVLRAACAEEFVSAMPEGLNSIVGGRSKGLSEGQAQRLAVARALLCGAPILLLDEATSALDETTEAEMLHNLMTGGLVQTCILVTHRPGAASFCTRHYELSDGCLRETAAASEDAE